MEKSEMEKFAYELLHLSRGESYKIYDRAIWVSNQFVKRYPEASRNKIYSWAVRALSELGYVAFPYGGAEEEPAPNPPFEVRLRKKRGTKRRKGNC